MNRCLAQKYATGNRTRDVEVRSRKSYQWARQAAPKSWKFNKNQETLFLIFKIDCEQRKTKLYLLSNYVETNLKSIFWTLHPYVPIDFKISVSPCPCSSGDLSPYRVSQSHLYIYHLYTVQNRYILLLNPVYLFELANKAIMGKKRERQKYLIQDEMFVV